MHVSPIPRARTLQVMAGLLVFIVGLLVSPASATSATHHVTISTYSYHPAALTVTAGDTVTWTNVDSVAHDVTVTRGPALFHSPLLSQGQSWTYTFTVAGPYAYICSVHPDMKASVTVQPAPVQAPAVAPSHNPAPSTSHQRLNPLPAATNAASGTAPVATTPLPVNSVSSSTQVNPLLIVGGALCAVLIFCLLMMASRPYQEAAPVAIADDQGDIAPTPQAAPPPPPSDRTTELEPAPAPDEELLP